MSASYNKIDYRIRISKSVERKMLCMLFQQLVNFDPLKEYNYIGLGSVSFIDFALYHRVLGIDKMYSIERVDYDENRFRFNIPYSCINLLIGETKDKLPLIDLSKKSIIWLDFDDKLNNSILSDISYIFDSISSGSFFCVSYNAQWDTTGKRFEELSQRIDNSYFPDYLHEKIEESKLNKAGIKKAYYEIINNVIRETIRIRNANGTPIKYEQLIYFDYNDGAEMNTLGWLFYDDTNQDKKEIIHRTQLDFIKKESESYRIEVPNLTLRELQALDSKLPNVDLCLQKYNNTNKDGFLLEADIRKYAAIYKYFPLFAETLI